MLKTVYPRTKRIISALEDQQAIQSSDVQSTDVIDALEQELAQLELFCLMNGLSLELFDLWKLDRSAAPLLRNKDD